MRDDECGLGDDRLYPATLSFFQKGMMQSCAFESRLVTWHWASAEIKVSFLYLRTADCTRVQHARPA